MTDHSLYVTPDRTTLVRVYHDGTAEVAHRVAGRWGVPTPLLVEHEGGAS